MDDPTKHTRYLAYGLMIVTSLATATARLASIESKSGKTPFLSANDRSRWCTIRSLVELGTYEIDGVVINAKGKRDPDWYSIDAVKHRGKDGREHFYSSKPTLLPTLLGGEYWLVRRMTGASLAQHPMYVGRVMLGLTNIIPLGLYFWMCLWVAERWGRSDWSRLGMMAAATWATFLTTFAVTLNNHLIAAISALLAIVATWHIWEGRIWEGRTTSLRWFVLAGFAAAFAAANELPALSLLAACGAAAFWRDPKMAAIGFLPPCLILIGASLATNHLAHGTWQPAYSQRRDGVLLGTLPASVDSALQRRAVPAGLAELLASRQRTIGQDVRITMIRTDTRWTLFDVASQRRYTLVRRGDQLEVQDGGSWYEYENTYWRDGAKSGVDRGEPKILTYFLHVVMGHHGIFSLSPIWIFSAIGIVVSLRNDNQLRGLAALTATLSLVCLVFFVFLRPLEDRNYGGVSCGFRWLFWLIPLWLICLLPALDRIHDKPLGRRCFYVALAVSAFSASYSCLNPWSHPWIYEYWLQLGWIAK